MSMSDWSAKINGDKFSLDSGTKHEGNKSLKCLIENKAILTLSQSETDSPASYTIDTWVRVGVNDQTSFFFRYQDLDNYFRVILGCMIPQVNTIRVVLSKNLSGVYTHTSITSTGLINDIWRHWKIVACTAMDNFYIEVWYDSASSDVSPTWELKVTKTLPKEWSSGGAFGLGSDPYFCPACGGKTAYFDLTKVYY